MIKISEVTAEQRLCELAQRFAVPYFRGDRGFVMTEEGDIGFAVIGLERTEVRIRGIAAPAQPFAYYDLLTRAVLNVLRDFNPIKIVIDKQSEYFASFGFKREGENMAMISTDIQLNGNCCAKE